MSYAVCVIPVSPLRLEPSHRTEMVSQQLFGESCHILEKGRDHWVKIKCTYDGYEGWCQDMHIMETSESAFEGKKFDYTSSLITGIKYRGELMQLPFASMLPADEVVKKELGIVYDGPVWSTGTAVKNEATIRSVAFRFLNTGYLWGGKSIFGIDCSGYTQTVFKLFNLPLLRDAYLQASQGASVGFLQEARCGDLAFFDNAEGRITHVGILLNSQEIIHASGKVRVDKIDAEGIINRETGERTHKLRIIRRYFEL